VGVIKVSELDPNFKYEIAKEKGGEHILSCFACGTCTAGCPIRKVDERYNPRKIIRMAILGMRDRVLSSDFIWFCSSCYTCQERCPQDVRITDLMTAIRNIASREGKVPGGFLQQWDLISKFGRLYELDEFDMKKRAKLDLPELPLENPEVATILEMCEVQK
jgi:heterodisulfide reductase subunit C